MKYKKAINQKLEEIGSVLLKDDYTSEGIGLLGGKSGIILFLFLYSRYTVDEIYESKAIQLLQESVHEINQGQGLSIIYSNGISGLGWVLEYLSKKEIIEATTLLHPLDGSISKAMLEHFRAKNWDALHGGIGIGLYLLERSENSEVLLSLKESIQILAEQAKQKDGKLMWVTENPNWKNHCYNFGLAHGIPSIISFLTKCYKKNICKNQCHEMLLKTVNYVVSNSNNHESKFSVFPTYINLEGEIKSESRLGWCYGDPGVLVALIQANEILGGLNDIIETTIKSICLRKLRKETRIVDAGLCHGAAGILHILNFLKLTSFNDTISNELIEYWIKYTLELATFSDGPAGYKKFFDYDEDKNSLYESSYGFLDGIAGIGLTLLTLLNEDFDWNESLYIS